MSQRNLKQVLLDLIELEDAIRKRGVAGPEELVDQLLAFKPCSCQLQFQVEPRDGVALIAEERRRQVEVKGYSAEHDDEHGLGGSLARAAACYAMPEDWREDVRVEVWPFDVESWKPTPKDRVRELVKAGALIAAEIDRQIRMDGPQ